MVKYPYSDLWLPLSRKHVDFEKIIKAIIECPKDHSISFHTLDGELKLCYVNDNGGLIDKFITVNKD
jgi:hypothetical protein